MLGAPRKGGFQRGETKAGGERRALCLLFLPADLHYFGAGGETSGAQAAAVTVSERSPWRATGREAMKRSAKRRGASAPGTSDVTAKRPSQWSTGWWLARASAESVGASHRLVRSGCIGLRHDSAAAVTAEHGLACSCTSVFTWCKPSARAERTHPTRLARCGNRGRASLVHLVTRLLLEDLQHVGRGG